MLSFSIKCIPSFNCRYYSTQTITFPYAAADHAKVFNPTKYFYVDKTKYIKDLEEFSESCNAITSFRPRRFGKTLFLSTLLEYYDINNWNEKKSFPK